jgi:uncharacterized membrane protein
MYKKELTITFDLAETAKIIESLDHERERWIEIANSTNNEDIARDYRNDIVYMDELISKFKTEAQKKFGENISEIAHYPRGISFH